MRVLFFVVTLFVFSSATDFENSRAVDKTALRLVHMLFRHGDRTPVRPYPNDPYNKLDSWPVSWGQLTNRGKDRHFQLGQFNRERYAGFLSESYIPEEVYVRSTDVDRTLMSAESHLAGLYPPTENQTWNENLTWQPIPVHTMPRDDDLLMVLESKCPRYFELVDQLNASPDIQKKLDDNKEMLGYLSQHSGLNMTVMDDVEYLYDTLFIETRNNKTLPEWTSKYFPEPMKSFNDFSFRMKAYTKEMQRLRGGPLVKEVVEHLVNYSQTPFDRKLFMYSAHDVTVATFLLALDAFDGIQPPYASMVLVELYEFSPKNFSVKLLYKNVSDDGEQPHVLQLPGCAKLCPLETFADLLKNVTDVDIRAECKLNPPPTPEPFNYVLVVELLGSLCAILMLVVLIGCVCWCHKMRNSHGYAYTSIQTA